MNIRYPIYEGVYRILTLVLLVSILLWIKKLRLRSDFYPRKGQGVFRHGKRFCSIQNTPCYFLTKIENPSGTDWGQHLTANTVMHQPDFTPLPPAARYSGAK